jgi:hypothetical protein
MKKLFSATPFSKCQLTLQGELKAIFSEVSRPLYHTAQITTSSVPPLLLEHTSHAAT